MANLLDEVSSSDLAKVIQVLEEATDQQHGC